MNITPINDKNIAHGYWEMYYDGELWFKCYYVNGKRVGYEELYTFSKNKIQLRFHL